MAEFTPNYGLHQWESTDPFLRTDFNQDLLTLDAALGRAERSAENTAYNVYNLMLQNDYEGKYTGYKKALLFDGFTDESGIDSKDGALVCSRGAVWLSRSGQGNVSLGYGDKKDTSLTTKEVTMGGNGTVTGFSFEVTSDIGADTSGFVQLSLKKNGTEVLTGSFSTGVIPSRETRQMTHTFSQPVQVGKGDVIELKFYTNGTAWLLTSALDGIHLGGMFLISPISGTSGTLTTKQASLPRFGRAMAWVRHQGGQVSVQLGGMDFGEAVERRTVSELLNGVTCTESAFVLDRAVEAGSMSVSLELDLNGESSMAVYDYGIALY